MKRPFLLVTVLAITIGLPWMGSAALLPENIWPNPEFEAGTDLDDPMAGVLEGWNRGGNDSTICQVTREAAVSPTHALAIVDENEEAFGEWYADLPLPSALAPGQSLNLQWYEAFSIIGGEMRVSALFLDATGGITEQNHFVVQGDSEGWTGSPDGSPLVKKNRRLTIPLGAVSLRMSLVSGGSFQTTGIVILDDLSVAAASPDELLAGNFWPNPTFETGQALDDPANAVPAGWERTGDDTSICLVTSENSVSPSHALLVSDPNAAGFGAWLGQVELAGSAAAGDTLEVQWFEAFQVAGAAEMRLSASFTDAEGTALENSTAHWVARGASAGWGGTLALSTFTRHKEALLVPASATRLRIELVSGGPASATGLMAIDNLSVARPAKPVVLFGNLLPNPTFELGENLDQASGTPTAWTRAGSEPAISQVTRALFASPTHALTVVDESAAGAGEWSAELALGSNLAGTPSLSIQWFEVFNVATAGPMRLSAQFFNGTQMVGESHFAAEGSSAGWNETLAQSSFTRRQEVLPLPANVTTLRLVLSSGTSPQTTGIMVIDDLSVAPPIPPPQALAGSFWLNPGFEEGAELDAPALGVPTGWARGGSLPAIDQIITDRFKSPSHALAVVDTSPDGYGEWYQFLPLAGIAAAGDILQVQWFEIFTVQNDVMRFSVLFFNASGGIVTQNHYLARENSEGWTGDLATSPFVARLEEVEVPEEADRLLVTVTSGGSAAATGTMLIDDLSIRVKAIVITNVLRATDGISITWESSTGAVYALEFSNNIAPGPFGVLPGAESITASGPATTYMDASTAGAPARFYRVVLVSEANGQ